MDLKTVESAYVMAINKWGNVAQLEMLQEEATELALATRKHIRKNSESSLSDLVDEIADTEIMIGQIKLMYKHIDLGEMIDSRKLFKIKRLIKRINNGSFEALPQE
jgi:phosphoribosyl-ATP pyrophosphohydrolase